MDALKTVLTTGARALVCKAEVHDAYNVAVDAENLRMVWGVADVNSWYKNAKGRVAQNWPFPLVEYWKRTHAVDPTDYDTL
jgi:4-hydroxyacetophenone monooxygenase